MQQFVAYGLAIQERLGITDKKGKGIVMRFSKLYPVEKLSKIVKRAESYTWFENNRVAGFMKAVGEINKEEREGDI